MARARWISLSKTNTGFVFATTHSAGRFAPDWIESAVAHEFGCDVSDLEFMEDDDMREFVSLDGTSIVEVHYVRLQGFVASSEIKVEMAA